MAPTRSRRVRILSLSCLTSKVSSLPAIRHVGDTRSLRQKYPRLEVVYVHERPFDRANDPPAVLWRWIYDPRGRWELQSQDVKSNKETNLYTDVLRMYDPTQIIRVPQDGIKRLTISRFGDRIVRESGLDSLNDPRVLAGYLRIRGRLSP